MTRKGCRLLHDTECGRGVPWMTLTVGCFRDDTECGRGVPWMTLTAGCFRDDTECGRGVSRMTMSVDGVFQG